MTRGNGLLVAALACLPAEASGQGVAAGPLVLTEAAVVYGAAETVFETADPAAAPADGFLGRLERGSIRVATAGSAWFAAGPFTVLLDAAVVRASAAPDGVRLCVDEGTAAPEGGSAIEAGRCVLLGADGTATDLPADAVPAGEAGPPPADVPWVEDDPQAAVDRVAASWTSGGGEGSESGDAQAGGSAVCLDTGGTGPEATGPDGVEVPETEIDRSQHRVNVEVTLEGY